MRPEERKEELKDDLRNVGLKASQARLELYEQLIKKRCAITADELFQSVKQKGIDFSTVYRNLNTFVNKGLVQSIHTGDGVARFEILKQAGHHHHHLICRRCKKIEVIHKCFIPAKLKGQAFKGFKELTHRLEFEGLCPSCG